MTEKAFTSFTYALIYLLLQGTLIKSVPREADTVNALADTWCRMEERQLGALEVKNRCGLARGKAEREGLRSGSPWSGVRGADDGVSGKR